LNQPLPIRVTRRAAEQISEAAAWWTLNRPAAPGAIVDELEQAFALIATQPRIGAIARDAKLAGVRRIHLGRVHYHLYYRASPNSVEVLALWHTSRGACAPV